MPKKIVFQPLRETHFPLLLQWLMAPHVKAWWDCDIHWTLKLIKEKYGTYVAGYKIENGTKKPLQAYVISVDKVSIGYIQLYNAHDFAREDKVSLKELPVSFATFDVFIGDPNYVGKGYGSCMMKQFLKEKVDSFYEACFVDPDTANIAAMRAYQKAGFKKLKTVNGGTTTWLMREKIR